jgi:hypothetical protein
MIDVIYEEFNYRGKVYIFLQIGFVILLKKHNAITVNELGFSLFGRFELFT